MHEHPLLDTLMVLGAALFAVMTSEKTLIFFSICFTLFRGWIAWRNRNRPPKD